MSVVRNFQPNKYTPYELSFRTFLKKIQSSDPESMPSRFRIKHEITTQDIRVIKDFSTELALIALIPIYHYSIV